MLYRTNLYFIALILTSPPLPLQLPLQVADDSGRRTRHAMQWSVGNGRINSRRIGARFSHVSGVVRQRDSVLESLLQIGIINDKKKE